MLCDVLFQRRSCGSGPPFNHRKHLLNLLLFSDLLIFLATICWMEFSQSIFSESSSAFNVLYQISPLSLFTHNCDSYFTYIWIILFNASTIVALSIVSLCIYAVHQTSFEPSCIIFLILTIIAFITVSTFPIIAFVSFFKLSIFVLSSLVQSNMNIIPAVFSNDACLPVHENLVNVHSDLFYQKLYHFIYNKPHEYKFNWNMFVSLSTAFLIPIFAFFDCETGNPKKKMKWTASQNTKKENIINNYDDFDDEFHLRIGVANKILAQHYDNCFWVPFHAKHVAKQLLGTGYSDCTPSLIRELRGYTMTNIVASIRQSFGWEFKLLSRCADDDATPQLTFYDKVLELQYMLILFGFVPLQTIFALYGLVYPYIIGYDVITDLYAYHSVPEYIVRNQTIKLLLNSALSSSDSIGHSLYLLINHWYFGIFCVCLIAHFIAMYLIIYKLWSLRYLFEMCLNVLIVQDNSILKEELIQKMVELRKNINATQIRNQKLSGLFGRYHLDKVIIEYCGEMHQCIDHIE